MADAVLEILRGQRYGKAPKIVGGCADMAAELAEGPVRHVERRPIPVDGWDIPLIGHAQHPQRDHPFPTTFGTPFDMREERVEIQKPFVIRSFRPFAVEQRAVTAAARIDGPRAGR